MTDYQGLTDDQIFALATQPEDLSDEARGALEAELRRRNISTDDIGAYEAEVAEINRSEELTLAVQELSGALAGNSSGDPITTSMHYPA